MDDLISRQEAIEALQEHRNLFCDNTPETFSKLSYAEKSRVDELDMAIATLINLPSAQPDSKELSPTHKALDTISRKAAIEALKEAFNPSITNFVKAKLAIDNLPSAQPETHEERTETHACDLISRQAAIDALDKRFDSIPMEQTTEILLLRKDLRNLPAAQPQRMRGRWIPDNLVGGGYWVRTACKHPTEAFAANIIYNFCPSCGADMREGEQDEH